MTEIGKINSKSEKALTILRKGGIIKIENIRSVIEAVITRRSWNAIDFKGFNSVNFSTTPLPDCFETYPNARFSAWNHKRVSGWLFLQRKSQIVDFYKLFYKVIFFRFCRQKFNNFIRKVGREVEGARLENVKRQKRSGVRIPYLPPQQRNGLKISPFLCLL